jgi:hypothetical protein
MAGGKESPRQKNDRYDVFGTHRPIGVERIKVYT